MTPREISITLRSLG